MKNGNFVQASSAQTPSRPSTCSQCCVQSVPMVLPGRSEQSLSAAPLPTEGTQRLAHVLIRTQN